MATKGKDIRLAVIGCIHVPFTDHDKLDWAIGEIAAFRPTHLVVNGDLLDCSGISKHGTESGHSLEDEIWEGGEVLKRLRQSVPRSCQLIFREGNHEQRIKREAGFVSTYFRSMLTDWKSKHREWGNWHPGEYEKTRKGITLIGPFAVHHGHRSGGNSDDLEAVETAGLLGKRGIVCVRSHTHRVVECDRAMRSSTVPEDRLWRANTGTFADINLMPYAKQVGSVAWDCGVFFGEVSGGNWTGRVARMPQRVRVA